MNDLWSSSNTKTWHAALDRYADVVANQGVARLADLDAWYRDELPALIAARDGGSHASSSHASSSHASDSRASGSRGHGRMHVTHAELVRATEWKMARGVWRAPNLVLVRGNDAADVERTSAEALAAIPDPKKPTATLATLAGVGPATASAIVAAAAPTDYPFFDELVAAQVPSLGKVAWTLGYYVRYASAMRERATELGGGWTPVMLERALWANVGGKAGAS
jgi:hypothetical protein